VEISAFLSKCKFESKVINMNKLSPAKSQKTSFVFFISLIFLIEFFGIVECFYSCANPGTIQTFESFINAVNGFWEISERVNALVVEATRNTENELSRMKNGKSTIKDVAKLWGTEWQKVGNEISKLEDSFDKTDEEASKALDSLTIVAMGYLDTIKVANRLKQVNEIREQYFKERTIALEALSTAKEMYRRGEDIGRDFTFDVVYNAMDSKILNLKKIENESNLIKSKILSYKKWASTLMDFGTSKNNYNDEIKNSPPLFSNESAKKKITINKFLAYRTLYTDWNNCVSFKDNGMTTISKISNVSYDGVQISGKGVIIGNMKKNKLPNIPISYFLKINDSNVIVDGRLFVTDKDNLEVQGTGIKLMGRVEEVNDSLKIIGSSINCSSYVLKFTK
jgi:hypothetical protein